MVIGKTNQTLLKIICVVLLTLSRLGCYILLGTLIRTEEIGKILESGSMASFLYRSTLMVILIFAGVIVGWWIWRRLIISYCVHEILLHGGVFHECVEPFCKFDTNVNKYTVAGGLLTMAIVLLAPYSEAFIFYCRIVAIGCIALSILMVASLAPAMHDWCREMRIAGKMEIPMLRLEGEKDENFRYRPVEDAKRYYCADRSEVPADTVKKKG